jgi:hypothetical protein
MTRKQSKKRYHSTVSTKGVERKAKAKAGTTTKEIDHGTKKTIAGITTTKTGQIIGKDPTAKKGKESRITAKGNHSTHKIFGVIFTRNLDTPPIGVLRIPTELEASPSTTSGVIFTRNLDTPPIGVLRTPTELKAKASTRKKENQAKEPNLETNKEKEKGKILLAEIEA